MPHSPIDYGRLVHAIAACGPTMTIHDVAQRLGAEPHTVRTLLQRCHHTLGLTRESATGIYTRLNR